MSKIKSIAMMAAAVGAVGRGQATPCQQGGFYVGVNVAAVISRYKLRLDKSQEVQNLQRILKAIQGSHEQEFKDLERLSPVQAQRTDEVVAVFSGLVKAALTKADGSLKDGINDTKDMDTWIKTGGVFDQVGSSGAWVKDLLEAAPAVYAQVNKLQPSGIIARIEEVVKAVVEGAKQAGQLKKVIQIIEAGSKISTLKAKEINADAKGAIMEEKDIPSLSPDTIANYASDAEKLRAREAKLTELVQTARDASGGSDELQRMFYTDGDPSKTALSVAEVAEWMAGFPEKAVKAEITELDLDANGKLVKKVAGVGFGACVGCKHRLSDFFLLGELGADIYFGGKVKIREQAKAQASDAPGFTGQQRFGVPILLGIGYNITPDFEAVFVVGGEFQGQTVDTSAGGELLQHLKGIDKIAKAINDKYYSDDATKKDAIDMSPLDGKVWEEKYKKHTRFVFTPCVGFAIVFAATPQAAFRVQYRCTFQRQITTAKKAGVEIFHSSHKIIAGLVLYM